MSKHFEFHYRESDVKPFEIDDGWHFLVLSFNDTATNMYVDTVKWSRIKESFRIIGEDNYAVEIEGDLVCFT